MNQNELIADFLSSGRSITPSQARNRFGVRNLRARVNDLRNEGWCVYTNRTNKGVSYHLGSPSREMVAAAYRHVGGSVFSQSRIG
jgi:hypothetical protein